MCRETIRKHLINIDRHENLFRRIPQLGLPMQVSEYLLYNMSLDDDLNVSDENDYDSDDGDDDSDDDDNSEDSDESDDI